MPRASRSRRSASYSRIEIGSDDGEDENEVPLLSIPQIVGDPEPKNNHRKSPDGSASLKRTFTDLQDVILRFYHYQKIAFFISLAVLLFTFFLFGLFLRSVFRSSYPRTVELQPAYFPHFGSRRVRIKYGPYTVLPSSMADFQEQQSTKPCENCLITFMQAGLEYSDGRYANADTGIWLHHVVQLDTAVDDTVCGKEVTTSPLAPNRFFASGNERSAVQMSAQGTQRTGYFLNKASTLITATELMNETPRNVTVMMTIDYEFIPALPYPPAFRNLTSVWLDVGNCQNSHVPVPGNSSFTLSTPSSWTLPATGHYKYAEGRIIFSKGHLHDGGERIEITRNEDELICDSVATYGGSPGFVENGGDMKHISGMTSCGGGVPSKTTEIVKAGDRFGLVAHYDMSSYKGMREADGTLAPVMGIAMMYLAPGAELGM